MEELNTGVTGLFEPENDEGNIEYKQHLIEPTPDRIERLISQMKYRLCRCWKKHYNKYSNSWKIR